MLIAPILKLKGSIRSFLKSERGLTTVEYAIAGSLVALAVVTAFTDLGEAVGNAINTMTGFVENGAG